MSKTNGGEMEKVKITVLDGQKKSERTLDNEIDDNQHILAVFR